MEFLLILQKRWSFDSVPCWNSSKRGQELQFGESLDSVPPKNIIATTPDFREIYENILEMDIWEKFRVDSNPGPQDHQSNTLTTRLRPQLLNRWKIFGIYAVTY